MTGLSVHTLSWWRYDPTKRRGAPGSDHRPALASIDVTTSLRVASTRAFGGNSRRAGRFPGRYRCHRGRSRPEKDPLLMPVSRPRHGVTSV
jgi:hypothetical protein